MSGGQLRMCTCRSVELPAFRVGSLFICRQFDIPGVKEVPRKNV